MKYSIVFAALSAVVIAGCGKPETASAPGPAPVTKQQASDASKAEPSKTDAAPAPTAAGPASTVAAAPATENKPGEPDAKPAKKDNKK